MKVRHTYRCYPTPQQEQHLAHTFGCARFAYNWGLNQRTAAYQRGGRMNYSQSSAALTALKRDPDYSWLKEVSSVPTQQALRQLQIAFVNFFQKRTRYPSFRRKNGQQSAEYTRSAFKFEPGNRRLSIAKLGRLKVKWSRDVIGDPTTVTIIRKSSGRYFVSMIVEVDPEQFPKTGDDVGIDFGISRLATLSNGERVSNPRYLRTHERKMKRIQKSLARKTKGSNRRAKRKRQLARLHERIADSRKDVQNKLARRLVERFDTICIEDLNLRGMAKNHSLARSLSDAGIGSAIRTLETKAAMHGKSVVKINRWFPSTKMCSECGSLNQRLTLSDREWDCQCGAHHDRDDNAAKNILAAGLAVTAHGDGVRASRTKVLEAACL